MTQKLFLSQSHWAGTLALLLANLAANSYQAERVTTAQQDLARRNIDYKGYRKVLFSALLNTSPDVLAHAYENGCGAARKVMVTMASARLLPANLWSRADTKAYGKYYAEYDRVVASVPQKTIDTLVVQPLQQHGETTMSVFKQIDQATANLAALKKGVTDNQVFDELTQLEAERKRLDELQNKPKAIVAAIAKIDDRIKEIVKFSDDLTDSKAKAKKADDTTGDQA